LLVKAIRQLAQSPEREQVFEGVATGAILAVLASLLLTRGVGVQGGVMVWLVFIIACGASMWLPTPLKAVHLFVASAVPSLVLLGTGLAIYAIPQVLGQLLCNAVSGPPSRDCSIPLARVMNVTLFVSLVSIPGIVAGLYARTRLIEFVKNIAGIDPKKVSRVEKFINASVRIGAILAGVFVAAR
jgi:hypothetical protein